MLDENKLTPGRCFFTISFHDEKMSIPEIQTYIYVGRNLLPSDIDSDQSWWYFQDPDSYLKKGEFITVANKSACNILRVDKKMLGYMDDTEGLITQLITSIQSE